MNKSDILEILLSKDFFSFSFKKRNGTIRYALGTLNHSFISQYWTPTETGGYEEPEDVIRYFDMDALAWRSFKVDSLIEIE